MKPLTTLLHTNKPSHAHNYPAAMDFLTFLLNIYLLYLFSRHNLLITNTYISVYYAIHAAEVTLACDVYAGAIC